MRGKKTFLFSLNLGTQSGDKDVTIMIYVLILGSVDSQSSFCCTTLTGNNLLTKSSAKFGMVLESSQIGFPLPVILMKKSFLKISN